MLQGCSGMANATSIQAQNELFPQPRMCFLVRQHLGDNFWRGEVDSALIVSGYEKGLNEADMTKSPFIILPADCTRQQALQAGSRCVLVKKILELYGYGADLNNLRAAYSYAGMRPYTFPSNIGRKNHSFPVEEFAKLCEDLPERQNHEPINIHVLAPVKETWWIALATNQIGEGCIEVTHKYDLKQREFLGPTTLTPEFAFVMANLALADKNKIIMDPFVGSGGALIGASHFGSTMLGIDIDWRIIHGGQPNKAFDQYRLPRPDFIRGDSSAEGRPFRELDVCKAMFDAILCDPPYGIRAGARKVGLKAEDRPDILPEHKTSHIPQTRKYDGDDVIRDLLDAAAVLLRPKGRVVFLFPVQTIVWRSKHEAALPAHPDLKLLYFAEQALKAGMSRVLVTMERIPDELHADKRPKI